VRKFLANLANKAAPRTMSNLRRMERLDPELEQGPSRFLAYERELRELRREIDELRRDHRRVAELYDAVFEWARRDAAQRGVAPEVDAAGSQARIDKLIAESN
jgi:hypothetical protein